MKKFLILLLAFTTVSCSQITKPYDEGLCNGVKIISKGQKDKKRYGIGLHERTCLPPKFKKIEAAGSPGAMVRVYPDNGKNFYLFDYLGVEVLTGRKSGQRTVGFEPLLLSGCREYDMTKKETFSNLMVGNATRIKYFTADGRECLLFPGVYRYYSFGPYDKMTPGCSGIMYKDKNGWHAMQAYLEDSLKFDSETSFYRVSDKTQHLFADAAFDEIIEVFKPISEKISPTNYNLLYRYESVWLARKGQNWQAMKVVRDYDNKIKVSPEAVDSKLLNKVLNLTPKSDFKSRPGSWEPVHNQRIGNNETSVVFL